MPRLVYREPQPVSRSDATAAFDAGDPLQISQALVDLTYHDADWKWVERKCLDYCGHSDPQVRGLAATCLGELARIHGQLNTELVIPRLKAMLNDPTTSGSAHVALSDIDRFVGSGFLPAKDLTMPRERLRSEGTARRFSGSFSSPIPDGWLVKESVTILNPDGQANVIASSEPLDGSVDAQSYAASQGLALREEFANYRELSYGPAKLLGGYHCYVRRFEWSRPNRDPVTQIQIYYAAAGRGYTVTATTLSVRFRALEPIVVSVLEGVLMTTGTSDALSST